VSHDRHMLRATADDLWLVAEGKLTPFDGDLDEYKVWLAKNAKADKAEKDKKLAKNASIQPVIETHQAKDSLILSNDASLSKKQTHEERQAIAQQKKALQNKLKKLELELNQKQTAIAPLTLKLADNDFYTQAEPSLITKISREQAELQVQIEALELDWLDIQTALDGLEGL
jgi:ATP-binding cassette, subfamily F, member 3